MVKLTEEKVLSSSRASSLRSVKNLNCWGSDLDDVSILRQLPNLEVLSLSVNQISTLNDLKYCPKLKEIYLRKNNLSDISELIYLKHLPQLKVLWLSENPCTDVKCYRSTVIRNIPNLTKLDNQEIDENERDLAEKEGEELEVCPSDLPDFSGIDLSMTLQEDDLARFMKTSMFDGSISGKIDDTVSSSRKVDLVTINEKRAKLGLKPLGIEYDSTQHTEPDVKLTGSTTTHSPNKSSRVLSAVKMLLEELSAGELQEVVNHAEELLHSMDSPEEKEALLN